MKAPYHLVEPSAWPIIGSFAVLVLTFGTIAYLHPSIFGTGLESMFKALGPWKILIGLGLVLFTMAGWWRDVVKEARTPGLHTPVVRLGLRYGMFLFIASEVMFFVAWFWAFFHYGLFPEHHPSGHWPPPDIHTFDPWGLPFLNTVILLTSGTTVTWAHHALIERNKQGLVWGLALTILLGLLFTGVQAYEYGHAPYKFSDGVFPGVFFMATGFHGAHVIIGTIFLIVCFFRALNDHFTPERHFGFEAAAWYWHFVDVVWLFLFFAIYIWGASPVTH
ncbi:MAG: cytochrome c oxidase subunit 3 [Alphaproteobacteria bacterium]|nr:cytochrome c oxidase subunit 3 [Alphaproteobacteria bacterium]